MNRRLIIWEAHAPSRAGDGALAVANFSEPRGGVAGRSLGERFRLAPPPGFFGMAPKTAREARALPRGARIKPEISLMRSLEST
jgi:hypothetical protein